MKHIFFLLSLLLASYIASSQSFPQNMGFEKNSSGQSLPEGWFSHSSKEFQPVLDANCVKSGKWSIRIAPVSTNFTSRAFGGITQYFSTKCQGKTLTVKAWMKYENVTDGYVKLLLQVQRKDGSRIVDEMDEQYIQGTSDWKLFSTTIAYPEDAEGIFFGAFNRSKGILWVDDFDLLLDGKSFSALKKDYILTPPPLAQEDRVKIEHISAARPLSVKDQAARDYAYWECEHYNYVPAKAVKVHPASAIFPGEVDASAPRISRKIQLRHTPVPQQMRHITDNLLYSGKDNATMYSTGLYAAPGEVITVVIPQQLKGKVNVQIGCHIDNLKFGWSANENWRRMPLIVRKEELNRTKTQVASAFGGLIYLTCSPYDPACSGEVEIQHAVAAPHFVLGQTTDAQWQEMLRQNKAPWGEIEGKDIIITCTTETLKQIAHPTQQAQMWDNIVNACYDLAQIPTPFFRKQRIVTDVHITAGYLHSGYPIMATHCPSLNMVCEDIIAHEEQLLRPTSKFSGWGFFHEIGHNMQNVKDWVFNGSTEVSVNFFSLYIFDHIMQGREYAHPSITPAETQEMMKAYFAKGAKFSDWQASPFLGLIMFRQIQSDFGWETFKKVFRRFHESNAHNGNPAYTDQEKIDHFVQYLSTATQRDMAPFFITWGIPVSAKCSQSTQQYPKWMPYNFPPKMEKEESR